MIVFSNSISAVVTLVEKLELSAVILVEKLAESVCKASTLASSVVTLFENRPYSVCKASTLASSVVNLVEILELSAVILVEKLPESVFKSVILVEKLPESVFKLVTLVEKLLDSAVKFKAVTLPVIFKDPVNECRSSIESPKTVEPLF